MHNLSRLIGICLATISGICISSYAAIASADESSRLYYEFTLSLESTRLDNLSLGDDPAVDHVVTEEYEFEVDLEYTINDQVYLFLNLSLIDETETVKPLDEGEADSGLERKQMGVAVGFGEEIVSELKIGRMEFVSVSEWWIWWDEELDAISVESNYGPVVGLLAVAEEQARESTFADFIDPELQDMQRIITSLSWQFSDDQTLILYYLDQADRSDSHAVGDFEDVDELDQSDADLSWSGVSYLGGFEFDELGEFGIELHYSRVSGDETLYEFADSEGGRSEVEEIEKQRVSGSSQSYLLSWNPAALDDWYFFLGAARGSGDDNPDDGRDESFRQTGLQGDSDVFGELYQPEISNMTVQAIGVAWEANPGVEIALLAYDYEQRHASDQLRDVNIELDTNGVDRDLGREIDLVLTVEAFGGVELTFIAAEFEAGAAYGAREGERSQFFSFELEYSF